MLSSRYLSLRGCRNSFRLCNTAYLQTNRFCHQNEEKALNNMFKLTTSLGKKTVIWLESIFKNIKFHAYTAIILKLPEVKRLSLVLNKYQLRPCKSSF